MEGKRAFGYFGPGWRSSFSKVTRRKGGTVIKPNTDAGYTHKNLMYQPRYIPDNRPTCR
jgi:hypothetical protein